MVSHYIVRYLQPIVSSGVEQMSAEYSLVTTSYRSCVLRYQLIYYISLHITQLCVTSRRVV